MDYIGRFAPSPTGPLHFGSLIAAVASHLEAISHQGKWLVRMEDLDKPREMPGSANDILQTLEAFGFEWETPVSYQSQRTEAYESALNSLSSKGLIYPCACTRKEIADSATIQHGIDGIIYPGICRNGLPEGKSARAWRIKAADQTISFDDQVQGLICQNIAREIGDFVLKRADGLHAYQLAVVVDDAEQKITHVVRGADLLDSTSRQIYLQQQLGLVTPNYAHIPVASNANGEKLSKQTLARPLSKELAPELLFLALNFLQQNPPESLKSETIRHIWDWAKQNWKLSKVPAKRSIQFSD